MRLLVARFTQRATSTCAELHDERSRTQPLRNLPKGSVTITDAFALLANALIISSKGPRRARLNVLRIVVRSFGPLARYFALATHGISRWMACTNETCIHRIILRCNHLCLSVNYFTATAMLSIPYLVSSATSAETHTIIWIINKGFIARSQLISKRDIAFILYLRTVCIYYILRVMKEEYNVYVCIKRLYLIFSRSFLWV